MGYFKDENEVYEYIGGVFRAAADHPTQGPKMAAAGITVQLDYSDPPSSLTIKFHEPKVEVVDGGQDPEPDVRLTMPADLAHKYWLGDYNLAVGLAKGQVKARGPVNKILKLVPITTPLFPIYRELIDEKESAAATA
jgi:SCP-2 sterol transfer family